MNYFKIYESIIEIGKSRIKKRGDHFHKHRIVPGYMNGKYIKDNISYLTRKEHRLVHLLRYKIYKQLEDKWAYYRLSINITDTELNEMNIIRGKLGNKKISKEKRILGGKTQGKINADSGQCAKIAHLGGLAQGPKNKERLKEFVIKKRKRVKVGNIIYESQTEAGKNFGIVAASVRDRVLSKNFPDWNYI